MSIFIAGFTAGFVAGSVAGVMGGAWHLTERQSVDRGHRSVREVDQGLCGTPASASWSPIWVGHGVVPAVGRELAAAHLEAIEVTALAGEAQRPDRSLVDDLAGQLGRPGIDDPDVIHPLPSGPVASMVTA